MEQKAKLSRRAGKVTGSTKVWYPLAREEKAAFRSAINNASSFGALPKRWQKLLLEGEKEIRIRNQGGE